MQIKNFGIYAIALYSVFYAIGAFSEMSSAQKNYASMMETVQLAAEASVQQAVYGSEYDYISMINPTSVEQLLDNTGHTFSNQYLILNYMQNEFLSLTNSNKHLTTAPLPIFSETTEEEIYNKLVSDSSALQRKETLVSNALLSNSSVYCISDDTLSSRPYNSISAYSADFTNGVKSCTDSYSHYNNSLYQFYYSDNADWRAVAEISSLIDTKITYPHYLGLDIHNIPQFETRYYTRPNIFNMGLFSFRGANLKINGGNYLVPSYLSDYASLLISSNILSLRLADTTSTDFVKSLAETELQGLMITGDTYSNHNCFDEDSLLVTGLSSNLPITYYTVQTPTNCGVTYLSRDLLNQLFVDNMNKLMLGSDVQLSNIGYVSDELNHSISDLVALNSWDALQPIEKLRLGEVFDNTIINNGLFNFICGKVSKESTGGYLYNNYYATSPSYAQTHTGTLYSNLPTVEYKTIEIHDTANKDILKLVYKDDTALSHAQTEYAEKYIVVAKVTFFADVSVSYENLFAKDAVYIGSHEWVSGSPIGIVDDTDSSYTYMSNDANATTVIYEDQASVRGLHKFTLEDNVANPSDIHNVRYSPVTGNVMYEYTTYIAVSN